jgi:hypothetical protein
MQLANRRMIEACGLGRKSTAELGSYRVLVVVNGGLGSGLIDFTAGAIVLRRRMPHSNGGSAI